MAANTRDIRRRIKSVKNTAQITKAMQMVAASKMRKAQTAALAGRPYATLLNRVLVSLGASAAVGEGYAHPLLERREGGRELVLLIATDKGLCGALNTNLFREAAKYDQSNTDFVVVGRKAAQFVGRSGRNLIADFELKDNFTFLEAKQVSKFCMEKFLSGHVNKVTVVFTDFINTLTQLPRSRTILPVSSFEVNADVVGSADTSLSQQAEVKADGSATEYLFEPSGVDVLGGVLPHYVNFQVYQMVLDSRASEHSARMVAMKNATDNAKQLIKDLTLQYNKVRQAAITTEILEIATAQMALG
jgi:F-type H+-transporting ATPase subunit gamma